jgi:hypothetical protein
MKVLVTEKGENVKRILIVTTNGYYILNETKYLLLIQAAKTDELKKWFDGKTADIRYT